MSDWLDGLKKQVEKKPITAIRLDDADWLSLSASAKGFQEFSIARSHQLLPDIKQNTLCLVYGTHKWADAVYLGIVSSIQAVTTLESRLKMRRCIKITPDDAKSLSELVAKKPFSTQIKKRLLAKAGIAALSSKQSQLLLERLAEIEDNELALKSLDAYLSSPKRFNGNTAFQEDAIRTALATFGMEKEGNADTLQLAKGKQSGLARIGFIEDNAVELDAKNIKGYDLVGADLTGRATFRKRDETLEVITANRRELEHCLGVDLIYINLTHKNVVMLQYKMLEPNGKSDGSSTDWIYRPDSKLDDEIARMKKFRAEHKPGISEYRINHEFFYLKFVKRDASLSNGAILTPLEHFEIVRQSPAAKGPKGGIRVSYNALHGNYLRPAPFMDLVRSGYIGSYAETTQVLKTLIDEILADNKAVVAAIQQPHGKT